MSSIPDLPGNRLNFNENDIFLAITFKACFVFGRFPLAL